jgi:hypothetical protein
MSANRSVQAAQRRRAGPSNSEPAIPGRGPQPSINSSQIFSNQSRQGQPQTGQNSRANPMSKQPIQPQMQQNNKLSSVNKMTIPQAITLITLRLGVLESKLSHTGDGESGDSGIDTGFLQSIMERLENLEKRSQMTPNQLSAVGSSNELNLMKQTVVQTKNSTIALVKENTSLKTQLDNLNKDFLETKQLLLSLQNMVMENRQKLLHISLNDNETMVDFDSTFIPNLNDECFNENLSMLEEYNTQLENIIQPMDNELLTGV